MALKRKSYEALRDKVCPNWWLRDIGDRPMRSDLQKRGSLPLTEMVASAPGSRSASGK
jgi:hypothetical protein